MNTDLAGRRIIFTARHRARSRMMGKSMLWDWQPLSDESWGCTEQDLTDVSRPNDSKIFVYRYACDRPIVNYAHAPWHPDDHTSLSRRMFCPSSEEIAFLCDRYPTENEGQPDWGMILGEFVALQRWSLDDVKAMPVAAILAVIKGTSAGAPKNDSDGNLTSSATNTGKWKKVRRKLEEWCDAGERHPPTRIVLINRLQDSLSLKSLAASTMQKAYDNSEKLRQWESRKNRSIRATQSKKPIAIDGSIMTEQQIQEALITIERRIVSKVKVGDMSKSEADEFMASINEMDSSKLAEILPQFEHDFDDANVAPIRTQFANEKKRE